MELNWIERGKDKYNRQVYVCEAGKYLFKKTTGKRERYEIYEGEELIKNELTYFAFIKEVQRLTESPGRYGGYNGNFL